MSPGGSRLLRVLRGSATAFVCWLVLAGLRYAGAFDLIDLRLQDMHFRWRGEEPVTSPIALVEVDNATIDGYGDWPLPRNAYALLLAALEEAGAQAVGIDLLFRGSDDWDPRNDLLLASVTGEMSNVVHSAAVVPSAPADFPQPPPGALDRLTWASNAALPLAVVDAVTLPYEDLLRETPAIGHVAVAVDPDGTIRRIPLVVEHRGRVIPSLALRLAATRHGEFSRARLEPTKRGLRIRWADGTRTTFPIDDEGATSLEFAGGPDSFPDRHSMLGVLQIHRKGEIDRLKKWFGGKLVLVGSTAKGEGVTDMGATPFESATPLVYVHANALAAVLGDRFLSRPPEWIFLGSLLVAALALGTLFMFLPLLAAAGVALGATVAVGTLEYLGFRALGWLIPSTVPLLLPGACYVTLASYRFVVLERWQRWRDRELALARSIQQRLLPKDPPNLEGLDVHGINIPAQEVGGDYFDWVTTAGNRLVVALGDVSGKGVAASLLMAHLRASFHAETRAGGDPKRIVGAIHLSLSHAVESGHFATFFLAALPFEGDSLVYTNAGHNPAYLVHRESVELLSNCGPPLAILDGFEYGQETRTFASGDVLVVYSDGVTESPVGDDFYGEERLEATVTRAVRGGKTARQIVEAILSDLRRVAGEFRGWDDITLLVVRKR